MKRNIAWILILIVDVAYIAWGAMAGVWPDHLLGPRGIPIITAMVGAWAYFSDDG